MRDHTEIFYLLAFGFLSGVMLLFFGFESYGILLIMLMANCLLITIGLLGYKKHSQKTSNKSEIKDGN